MEEVGKSSRGTEPIIIEWFQLKWIYGLTLRSYIKRPQLLHLLAFDIRQVILLLWATISSSKNGVTCLSQLGSRCIQGTQWKCLVNCKATYKRKGQCCHLKARSWRQTFSSDLAGCWNVQGLGETVVSTNGYCAELFSRRRKVFTRMTKMTTKPHLWLYHQVLEPQTCFKLMYWKS